MGVLPNVAVPFVRCPRFSLIILSRKLPVYDREALRTLILQRALRFGEFTLASGKASTYYLDGKQVTLDAEGAYLIGEGLLDLFEKTEMPDAVGGMSIGADPITSAVITMSAVRRTPIRGFLVRKQPKGHGTNKFIEGPVQPGEKVVIVEDVVTTGGSSLKAIDRVKEFGLKVIRVAAVVDRMEGASEAFADRGIPFSSLFTIRDFGIDPPKKG